MDDMKKSLSRYEDVITNINHKLNTDQSIAILQKSILRYQLLEMQNNIHSSVDIQLSDSLAGELQVSDLFHLYVYVQLNNFNR